MGAFKQNDTGDCFFLASLIAIAEDAEGKRLIEFSLKGDGLVVFPNLLKHPVAVTQLEMDTYKLVDSAGNYYSEPVSGDPDIKRLEIAADKIWKKNVKLNGLWDDVPMNAVFMFSSAEQILVWNKRKVDTASRHDISKYQRLPVGTVKEKNVSTKNEVATLLKHIVLTDNDGISMVLIDYIRYHAVAIVGIDFSKNSYKYIGTHLNTLVEESLDDLLDGVVKGRYVINYVEI